MKVFIEGKCFVEKMREVAPEVTVPGNRQRTRENVARWLARYAEDQDCDVEIVFESGETGEVLPPVEHHGRVTVRNLSPGEGARRQIAGPANRAAEQDRVYVVTEDQRLTDALEGGNARVFSADRFIRRARTVMGADEKERYAEPDEKYSGLSEEEVDFWVDFFDDED